ncbi:MAG: glycogen synthase [Planctomycetes bacterium]|jgi:starch synthase|nr:glycogen synthase [Planctomycetota bacterium]
MSKKLRIIHVSSEVYPFSKTGGLADVACSLPKAIKNLGHEIGIITPLYGRIIDKNKLKLIADNVSIRINSKERVKVSYWQGELEEGLAVYFIENGKYFSKHKKIYGSHHENIRFLVFDLAAINLLLFLKKKVDIIHCHDWQTGLIPYYLRNWFKHESFFKKTKTIYTIHNLIFQLGHNWWEIPADQKDFGRTKIPHLSDPAIENINFAKRAILSADIINTVSEQYRAEIITKNFGQDLHRILRNRKDYLFGIINGINYHDYNPQNDASLKKKYDLNSIVIKEENKKFVQKKFGLQVDKKIPLFCTTSRIAYQKGFYLIINIIEKLLKLEAQFIFMGDGAKEYIKVFKKLQKKFPKRLLWLPFNQKEETLLYAASDFMLLPSNHEPCGINQLIAMRYGCIPIVREVGGLNDTVDNYNPTTNKGTGFTFKNDDEYALYGTIIRAIENYKHKELWPELVEKVMDKSSSWEIPAQKYIKLYRKALKLKKIVFNKEEKME